MSPGIDNLNAELIKYGSTLLKKKIATVIQQCMA
jgi:hypothetical protein